MIFYFCFMINFFFTAECCHCLITNFLNKNPKLYNQKVTTFYKVAHVKQPPLALRGNRKNTSFFVFLKFFHFCRRMPKQEQKQSKNWGKTCKILTFFFPTTYEYVTKSAFFLPYIWTFAKMAYMGRKWKKSFFCCLFYALIWAL